MVCGLAVGVIVDQHIDLMEVGRDNAVCGTEKWEAICRRQSSSRRDIFRTRGAVGTIYASYARKQRFVRDWVGVLCVICVPAPALWFIRCCTYRRAAPTFRLSAPVSARGLSDPHVETTRARALWTVEEGGGDSLPKHELSDSGALVYESEIEFFRE